MNQLSSLVGDRTEAANRKVVAKCLARRDRLEAIVRGFESQDAALAGDCAEVMTEVAEKRPEWVTPYARVIVSLLASRTTRVRWEAAHSLALIATLVPEVIAYSLPRLGEMIRSDPSVIARDHAVDTVGNYANTSPRAAREAFPLLVEALAAWNGKQAAHALDGLANVAERLPNSSPEIRTYALSFIDHPRGVIRKAARALIKRLDKV